MNGHALRRRFAALGTVLGLTMLISGELTMGIANSAIRATRTAPTPKPSQPSAPAHVQDLSTVINNITAWLVGISVSLATLFLTIGGVRYLLAGGDPGEINRAKDTFKYAAIGYGVAVLAPVLVTILKGFVGAS